MKQSADMEVIASNKGAAEVCYGGFMYTSRLPKKQTLFCKGSLKNSLDMTDPNDLVGHNHLPDVTEVSLAKARNTTGACWPGSR